jgi:hypothetical protein
MAVLSVGGYVLQGDTGEGCFFVWVLGERVPAGVRVGGQAPDVQAAAGRTLGVA